MSDLNDDFDFDATPAEDFSNEPAPVAPSAFEIPDDAHVSVKIDGEDKLLPWKEARAGVMFQSAFTKKTQDLARQRQEYEREQKDFQGLRQQYDQRIQTLTDVLKNPQQLASLYMHAASLQQGQAPPPPQPLTTDFLPKIQEELEQKLMKRFGQQQAEFSQRHTAERYETELTTFMNGVLTNHPLLKAIPGIEDTVYGRVAAMGVSSMEEAKEQARVMVESMSLQIQKAYEDQQKRNAVEKANAVRNGIQPRGGQAPAFNRTNVKKLEDLDNDFLAYLQQADRAEQ